jgi:hypothetical protein
MRDWQKWVAWRQSSLQLHRRKAVNKIPIPESGHSSLIPTDPNPPYTFLQSGRMPKYRFWGFASSKQPFVVSGSRPIPDRRGHYPI